MHKARLFFSLSWGKTSATYAHVRIILSLADGFHTLYWDHQYLTICANVVVLLPQKLPGSRVEYILMMHPLRVVRPLLLATAYACRALLT